MPRLHQNDRERAVCMCQAGMTHQAATDHFDVSRITISRLMIRLRQTDRTNDRPCNDRPRVSSQRQDRHLRLFHLRKRNFDHVFQHDNARCHVTRVCPDFLNQNHIHVLPGIWICHQFNIYGMNSVDVFATIKIYRKHYRICVTHLGTNGTTPHKPLSND